MQNLEGMPQYHKVGSENIDYSSNSQEIELREI